MVESRERVNVLLGLSGAETEWRMAGRLPRLPRNELSSRNSNDWPCPNDLTWLRRRPKWRLSLRRQELTRITSIIPEFGIGAHSEREPEGGDDAWAKRLVSYSAF